MLNKFFKLGEHRTDFKTEVIAGITTFLTMAYILFVNFCYCRRVIYTIYFLLTTAKCSYFCGYGSSSNCGWCSYGSTNGWN